jgi:hypothetical protein
VDFDLGTASGLLALTEIILRQREFPNSEKLKTQSIASMVAIRVHEKPNKFGYLINTVLNAAELRQKNRHLVSWQSCEFYFSELPTTRPLSSNA